MKGSIYVSQKCHKCGSGLGYIEGRGILQCPKHPDVNWTGNCRVKFGRTHSKRFKTVNEAERHLTYLRAQTDHNVFDVRDWQKDAPLSFLTLRNQFLKHKHRTGISFKQIRHIEYVLEKAGRDWDKMNIKQITEAEIDDFFNKNHEVGNKTLANWKSVLNHFWTWVVRRERRQSKIEMPVFPEIKFKLAWRNIVDIETQEAILDEISRISFDINPRIWLGVKLLTLYPKIRPGELRNVQEGHINLAEQWIVFPEPKEGEPKFIHLVPEDCELIKSLWEPRGLPQMFFFRHLQSRSGIQAGRQFGPKYFKTWWDRACKNLGITGIDLYGGTRHSTVTALGKVLSPEQIQRGATGHASDAFKRYFLPNLNEAHVATRANHDIRKKKTGKIMTFREKKS
jgi:integrase